MKMALDRGHRQFEDPGDFLAAQVVAVEQENGRPLRRRQLIHGAPNRGSKLARLARFKQCGRRILPRQRDQRGVQLARDDLSATNPIQADAVAYGEQPRAEPVLNRERVNRGEGFQEGFLADFLRVVMMADHAPDKRKQSVLVKIDQFARACRIACSCASDESTFVIARNRHGLCRAKPRPPYSIITATGGSCCRVVARDYNRPLLDIGQSRNNPSVSH